jgi:hypothetical protein
VHVDPPALTIKLDFAGHESKKRIVFASANVTTGLVPSAPLPDNDATRAHRAAARHFDAQSLARRFAAIAY